MTFTINMQTNLVVIKIPLLKIQTAKLLGMLFTDHIKFEFAVVWAVIEIVEIIKSWQ